MKLFALKPVYAHCDLPCGVYDPAQARIEAESIKAMMHKYADLDEHNKQRAIMLIEQRAELVKQHLWILWTDYFKPVHLETHPELHTLFWNATKQAGECKHHLDEGVADELLAQIAVISDIFWQTKKA